MREYNNYSKFGTSITFNSVTNIHISIRVERKIGSVEYFADIMCSDLTQTKDGKKFSSLNRELLQMYLSRRQIKDNWFPRFI